MTHEILTLTTQYLKALAVTREQCKKLACDACDSSFNEQLWHKQHACYSGIIVIEHWDAVLEGRHDL